MKKIITVLLLLLFVSGCDTFFTINTLVIDDKTGEPLSGAKATLVLDEVYYEPNVIEITDSDGTVGMFMNKPANSCATLTIEKEGYNKWSTQFRGAPRKPFIIQLIPLDED
jgi:hypothetical protein